MARAASTFVGARCRAGPGASFLLYHGYRGRMQSGTAHDTGLVRRTRVACPRCGEPIDIGRMRAHLREVHQVGAAELEATFLTARRAARRNARSAVRR